MANKTEKVKIRLDKKELKMLKFYAKNNGLTVSDYIRKQTIGYSEVSTPVTTDGVLKKFKLKE